MEYGTGAPEANWRPPLAGPPRPTSKANAWVASPSLASASGSIPSRPRTTLGGDERDDPNHHRGRGAVRPRGMVHPHAISLLGRSPDEVILRRKSDRSYPGDRAAVGDVFRDGDELEFAPRPHL